MVEFLKSLQILPQGTPYLIVDESFNAKNKKQVEKNLNRGLIATEAGGK